MFLTSWHNVQWNNRWKGIGNRVQQRFRWAKTSGTWSLLLGFLLPWYAIRSKPAGAPPLLLLVHWCAMDLCIFTGVCTCGCVHGPFSHKKTKSLCKAATGPFTTKALISWSLGAFCLVRCPMGNSWASLWVTSRSWSHAILQGKRGTEQWGSSWDHGKGSGLCPWHVRGHLSWEGGVGTLAGKILLILLLFGWPLEVHFSLHIFTEQLNGRKHESFTAHWPQEPFPFRAVRRHILLAGLLRRV